jgi:Zn-dependent M28 family amino/carboxypeptidase
MKALQQNLYNHVQFLTELRPYRNFRNLKSLQRVRDYIIREFQSYGLPTEEQTWVAKGNGYANVIGVYNAHKSRRLIVGAHYDVCGDQPGADDNASAVAGLLETARMVAATQPDLDYRIDFVAYSLEEPPFYGTRDMGSYVHAKSLYNNKADVIGLINYEMIGYFSDEPNSQPYPDPMLAKLYPNTANFIVVVGIEQHKEFNNKVHALMAKDSGIDVQIINFPKANDLAAMSDQRNYWPFGYPALMINDTSFLRNPNYHETSDTIDTLNFPKMTEVVSSTFKAVCGMG